MIRIIEILDYLKKENIKFEYFGDENFIINDYSTFESIKPNSILWVKNSVKINELNVNGLNNLLIVTSPSENFSMYNANFIVSNNSKEVFFSIINKYFMDTKKEAFISSKSVIETKSIGNNVFIGHNCYIGPMVEISDDVTIKNNVVIEGKVRIGRGTTIYSGVVIGSDGYGYFQNENGKNIKVPHLGGVVIGMDVEIGANTCIDKGTLGDTVIGNNVKIDNLCHIAHNVVTEDNVCIIALSMIAGSVKLKENSYIAPSASIMNQLTVGRNSLVGLGAVVVKEVEDNVIVAGVPAKVIRKLGD